MFCLRYVFGGNLEMDKELKEILNKLKMLNSNNHIIKQEDFDEQYDNLEEFKILTDDLNSVLNNLELVNKNNGDEVNKVLAKLHRIITTFKCHFSKISDLNMKIFEDYKEKMKNGYCHQF